jgi:hypothetical protein
MVIALVDVMCTAFYKFMQNDSVHRLCLLPVKLKVIGTFYKLLNYPDPQICSYEKMFLLSKVP